MPTTIKEIADRVPASGTPNHRIYEPASVNNLPVLDNANRYSSNVTTSIDCYVSGQYTTRRGKIIEVTQRYMIYVSYNKDTQVSTMNEARTKIVADFQQRYGSQFNVSNIFVPALPVPKDKVVEGVPPGQSADAEFYAGSKLWKSMAEYQKARYDIGTEREKARTNIESIRKRYKR